MTQMGIARRATQMGKARHVTHGERCVCAFCVLPGDPTAESDGEQLEAELGRWPLGPFEQQEGVAHELLNERATLTLVARPLDAPRAKRREELVAKKHHLQRKIWHVRQGKNGDEWRKRGV